MASWDLRRLQQHLDRLEAGPLYLLLGDDQFMLQEAYSSIKAKVLSDPTMKDFNFDQYFATESSAAEVRDAVEMLPMMSSRRLVAFRGCEHLKDKDWDLLMPVLESPLETTTFVLMGEKMDKRKKHFKKISESGVVVELNPPYDNQIPTWIDYISFQLELKMGPSHYALVHQLVGNNLMEIRNELMKLKQFLGDRENPTEDDILKVITSSKVEKVFELTDALGKKDKASALTILANLLEHQQNEFGIIALIHRHFRILSSLKLGLRQNLAGQKLAQKVGVPQFFLKNYLDQSRAWDDRQLARVLAVLTDTDRALKSSALSSHVWLENFIVQACHAEEKAWGELLSI